MHGLGDNLMLTPTIHALKEKAPNDEIHIAGFKYLPLGDIWEPNPYVTSYHELDIDFHPTYWNSEKLLEEMPIIQLAIDKLSKKIEADEVFFVTIKDKSIHEIFSIGKELGVEELHPDMEIYQTKKDEQIAKDLIKQYPHLQKGKFYVLHQGAGNYIKAWDMKECEQFMHLIEKETGFIPFIIDNPKEDKPQFKNAIYSSQLAKVTPGAVSEIMQKAKFFVGTDSFPMHLATATNLPIVSLFISTSIEKTGPLSDNIIFLCSLYVYTHTPLPIHYEHPNMMLGSYDDKIKYEQAFKAVKMLRGIVLK